MLGRILKIPIRWGYTYHQGKIAAFEGRDTEWSRKDLKEASEIHQEVQQDRTLQKLMHAWKHPLKLKQEYKARRVERESKIPPMPEQESKLVVHSQVPITSVATPRDDQIFAVVRLAGLQYKVTKNDLIIAEKLPYEVGQQFTLDSVMLVGTPSYTLIGRPLVEKAQVYMTVEEQTLSEKLIVFKKIRRKHYKKQKGHRQELTILRVEKIEHEVEDKQASLFIPVS
ncbi:unnamed protein product [Blepharisma stoltei]|uniref:Large ribosomal subunit protein bL21m n=1 Tax=Blepharisma stoltei TaxID=1481888 RepID=A0AAU9KCA8_9CILI|nr:unnamed protein product [Blepharisma stoltei]